MESMQSQTIQLTLPKSDIKMLKKLASGMGWVVSAMSSKKKSGIEKGLEDIRKNHEGQVHRPERVNQGTCPYDP